MPFIVLLLKHVNYVESVVGENEVSFFFLFNCFQDTFVVSFFLSFSFLNKASN